VKFDKALVERGRMTKVLDPLRAIKRLISSVHDGLELCVHVRIGKSADPRHRASLAELPFRSNEIAHTTPAPRRASESKNPVCCGVLSIPQRQSGTCDVPHGSSSLRWNPKRSVNARYASPVSRGWL